MIRIMKKTILSVLTVNSFQKSNQQKNKFHKLCDTAISFISSTIVWYSMVCDYNMLWDLKAMHCDLYRML